MDGFEVFEAIMDSAVLLDKAGRILNWNPGAAALFGYSKKEVMGKSINFIYERNYPFAKLIQELAVEQKKWHEETDFIKKNGLKGNCMSYLSPLNRTEQNKITALLIHHNTSQHKKSEQDLTKDVTLLTEQLQNSLKGFWGSISTLVNVTNIVDLTEKKLRESELQFHLLAENAKDIISRHATDGTYLYVSPACKTSIGFTPEELIGNTIYKFIHHDDVCKIKKTFTRRRDRNNISNNRSIVYRIKRKEGEFRWFESNIRLISHHQKFSISEIQLASRDITDRILDKKARLRGQQLAHVFRLSTMEEMASGMAHEISQPLAAIVNYTRGCVRHLQNADHDKDELKQVMGKAVAQAERAGEIVHRLKNFFCKGQLVKTPCKLNNMIRETVGLIKSELMTSKTKIDYDFDKEIPMIIIDKIQVQQVLLNLMQNAIEAMQHNNNKEKRICIKTKNKDGNTLEITLSDTGPGFSKECINKVFMPFFTTKAHGRGMGLAICRSIIEAHGGGFTINPNLNNSNWIKFTLPISV